MEVVERFLARVGGDASVDDEVADYLLQIAETSDDVWEAAEAWIEYIADLAPEDLEYLASDAALNDAVRAVEDILACAGEGSSAPPGLGTSGRDGGAADVGDDGAAAVANLLKERLRTDEDGGIGGVDPEFKHKLEVLRALCDDDVDEETLSHLLTEECGGDLDVASNYIADGNDVRLLTARLEERRARRAREDAERAANSKEIFERYGLQAVSHSRKPTRPPLAARPAKNGGNNAAPKVRYHDSEIVTSRGEKYIVQKIGQEWDGGSRGKVITKGKRGKGYH